MKTQWKNTGSVNRKAIRPDQRCTRATPGTWNGITRWRRPHMRLAVRICTTTSATATEASHAFAAIVDEKTVVTMSVYVSLTSASGSISRV